MYLIWCFMFDDLSTQSISREVGKRLKRVRLQRNLTQEYVCAQAGLSRNTLSRLENGSAAQLDSLIKVMRVLGLLNNLELLVPEDTIGPIERIEMEERIRKKRRSRASGSGVKKNLKAGKQIKWGDEE